MSIETAPNRKQQLSFESVWHTAEAAHKLNTEHGHNIKVNIIGHAGDVIEVNNTANFKVLPGNVAMDLHGVDTQILHEIRNTADNLLQVDKLQKAA